MLVIERREWKELQLHQAELSKVRMSDLFATDPERAARFSVEACGLFLDYSKNIITEKTVALWEDLLRAVDLEGAREGMFSGAAINTTEKRAVLHTALRNRSGTPVIVDGEDVMGEIDAELEKMRHFCDRIHQGEWRGRSGKPIRHVINIGIGGSDLGPAMIVDALKPYQSAEYPRLHFVSNVDGAALYDVLAEVDLEETLFLIASKTFTTMETMTNAHAARAALIAHFEGDESAVQYHFAALSTNEKLVSAFGIDLQNMFRFWDWVGGRYSAWSAIGLSIALAVGFENFEEILAGAHEMDLHFRTAPLRENMPLLLAMLGVWYNNFFGWESHCVLPYHQHLQRFPAYLQQLDMESNGKRVTHEGEVVTYATGPIIWGDVGTNSQHAFFQLLHQGTHRVPCDFILATEANHPSLDHQQKLIANCLAQSEALMKGKGEEEVRRELVASGKSAAEIDAIAPHKVFEGNRPSNTLLMKRLTPKTLGALVALYEQRVFVQGIVWGINSFDQYGVQLGKVLAGKILQELQAEKGVSASTAHDSSTAALLRRVMEQKG